MITLDEIAHIAGAALFVALVTFLPFGLGIPLANAAFWFAREWEQARAWPWHWSYHRHREWLWPAGAGIIACAIIAVM